MKLQLQDSRLRLRLSEAEFASLLADQPVISRTPLPGGALVIALRATDAARNFAFAGALPALNLLAPRAVLLDYQQRLPCRAGIEAEVESGDGLLALSLEVDVRDSVRSRGAARRSKP